jgi:hypothetical protein
MHPCFVILAQYDQNLSVIQHYETMEKLSSPSYRRQQLDYFLQKNAELRGIIKSPSFQVALAEASRLSK